MTSKSRHKVDTFQKLGPDTVCSVPCAQCVCAYKMMLRTFQTRFTGRKPMFAHTIWGSEPFRLDSLGGQCVYSGLRPRCRRAAFECLRDDQNKSVLLLDYKACVVPWSQLPLILFNPFNAFLLSTYNQYLDPSGTLLGAHSLQMNESSSGAYSSAHGQLALFSSSARALSTKTNRPTKSDSER